MTTPSYSIEADHLYRRFGRHEVLRDITLRVPNARIYGLLGPSGSGKTTLVKMIAGIDVASEGTVTVLGEQMPKLSMLKRIGYMAQSDALYTELTAAENLAFFGSLYGLSGGRLKQRIDAVLSLVNLKDFLKREVRTFSGGMKRRLSLAVAMLHEPEILILDEPTVGIDPVLRKSVWNEFENICASGVTLLVTTHVMDEAEKCHHLGMIRDGRLIADGTPEDLKRETRTATIEEAFLAYGGASA